MNNELERREINKCIKRFDKWVVKAKLRSLSYQREGVEWMLRKELGYDKVPLYNQFVLPFDKEIKDTDDRYHTAIMADDMGLGKTIQFMGLMLSNFKKKTLIVLPNALLQQWNAEVYRLLGHKVYVYHGVKNTFTKKSIKNEEERMHYLGVCERVKQSYIVITTYGTLTRSYASSYNILGSVKWSRVIFDEAHYLRSPYSKVSMAAKTLRSSFKWMITGTPIQNNLKDLLSLLEVGGYNVFSSRDLHTIQLVLSEFMLRRTKESVGIHLPELSIHKVIVPWKYDIEKTLSLSFHRIDLMRKMDNELQVNTLSDTEEDPNEEGEQREKQVCEVDKQIRGCMDNFVEDISYQMIGRFIRMKQMCTLPYAMKMKLEKYKETHQELTKEMNEFLEMSLESHSKMDAVLSKIEERKDNGRPKIVFAYFRDEIDMIEDRVKNELGLTCGVIDGRTTKNKRDEVLEDLYDVLVLQIKTCCEGLNLQKYKEIYFTSIHWNPSSEEQAIARSHRIGQDEQVDIFQFIMQDMEDNTDCGKYITMDMYCDNVQERKRELIRQVVLCN